MFDDVPTIGEPDEALVDEDDLPASTAGAAGNSDVQAGDDLPVNSPISFDGNLDIDFGADGVGDIVLSTAGLAALGLTSGGLALKCAVSPDGHTLTAFTGAAPGDGDVFTLVITNVADGDYTFTLLDQLDHPTLDGVAGDDTENNIVFSVNFTASDGDTVAGAVSIDIVDDVPAQTAAMENGAVDEDDLDTPLSQGTDTDAQQDGPPVTTGGSLTSLVTVGADEDGTFGLTVIAGPGVDSGFDSKGDDIFITSDGTTLTGTADGRIVFTLALSGTNNATYTFTLFDQLDHPLTDDPGTGAVETAFEDTLTIDFSTFVTFTDFDGDQITLQDGFTIDIVDDIPVANDDTDKVYEGEVTTGNVLTGVDPDLAGTPADTSDDGAQVADVFGADGPDAAGGVVGVAAGDTGTNLDNPSTLGVTVTGAFGDLVLNPDGFYSYTQNVTVTGEQTDTFTYTIKDGDGDLTTATLAITVSSVQDVLVVGTYAAGDGGASVALADVITDFQDGIDLIGLFGLTFTDLNIDQTANVVGDGTNDTQISVTATSEILAVLDGIDSGTTINEFDFTVIT